MLSNNSSNPSSNSSSIISSPLSILGLMTYPYYYWLHWFSRNCWLCLHLPSVTIFLRGRCFLYWTYGVIFIFFYHTGPMGLSPGPECRRYLHSIFESPFLKTSAPLLEHSYDSYGTLGDICNLHYFLWDYRRDLDTGDTSI